MSSLEPSSASLHPSGAPRARTLTDRRHCVDFSNKRPGLSRLSGMSFASIATGNVVTDGYDAQTPCQRVGTSLPQTARIRFRSARTVHEALVSGALPLQKGLQRSAIHAEQVAKPRPLHGLVRDTPQPAKLGLGMPSDMPADGKRVGK